MKTIGVVRECGAHETRVALVPLVTQELMRAGAQVLVEQGAGLKAGFFDEEYKQVGAVLVDTSRDVMKNSDLIVSIDPMKLESGFLAHKMLIGLCEPYEKISEIKALKEEGVTLAALELVPRISRAQSMDVLSSQANIAGYVAVLKAAAHLNKVIPLFMTAAGTIKPAHVLVLGAGVAGLQAIATAKRLGAVVHAYDVRSAVKEQVESLGAKFLSIDLEESGEGSGGYAKALSEGALIEQRTRLGAMAKDMDIIITTAQIPGRTAPRLLDENIFSTMKDGSVIIDLAAKSGGNVAFSRPNEWQKIERVWLYGADDLARMAPKDASFTFSKNVKALIDHMKQKTHLDLDDEILREVIICSDKKWVNQSFAARVSKI